MHVAPRAAMPERTGFATKKKERKKKDPALGTAL
jgi:hypothetical protein